MGEILCWENVNFAYDGQFKLRQVNYALQDRDFTIFFGPNGAGKTTLFKLAIGLLKPDHGRIILDGQPLAQWPIIEVAKRVAYLEQEVQYLFPFTVEEVVLMGRFPHTVSQFWDRKADLEIVAWAMEVAGVLRFAKRSIFQLSGGERRKVEIARALCQKPKLMLLDEPTVFLDLHQQIEFFEILGRLNREEHITIGFISHQVALAKNFVKTAVFLKNGQIIEWGSAHQLLGNERISQFFELASSEVR